MIFKKRDKAPKTIGLNEGLYVVVDPDDAQQTIAPEPGGFYQIEANGLERAFLFNKYDGDDGGNCQRCCLGDEDSDYAQTVCRKMCCLMPECDCYGVEYIVDNQKGCYVPKPAFNGEKQEADDYDDDAPQTKDPVCDLPPAERRVRWENALKELNEQARAHEQLAEEWKARAKRSQNYAKTMRAKIFELLTSGAENYTSDTPLFDALEDAEREEDDANDER